MRTASLYLLIMLLLPAAVRCDRLTNPDGYPRVIGGVLDLREWDFDRRDYVPPPAVFAVFGQFPGEVVSNWNVKL